MSLDGYRRQGIEVSHAANPRSTESGSADETLLNNSPGSSSQAAPMAIPAGEDRATRVRWKILALIAFTLAVTALNRLNLSIAGKSIEEEFSAPFCGVTLCFRSPGEIYATGLDRDAR